MKSILLCCIIGITGCYTHVDAGHVGVKVDSCTGGGVDPTPLGIGYHSTWVCTSVYTYPVNVQTAVWTKNPAEGHPTNEEISFTNADQMQIAVDVSLAYQIVPSKVPEFYAKFRSDDLDTFTHGFLRNMAREKFDTLAGKYHIDQIMGDNAQFLSEVRAALQKDLDPIGVHLEQFGLIGAPRPPQGVIDSINAKIAAVQKSIQVENELRQAEAESRKIVAKAKGDADARKLHADAEAYANQKVASSLSPVLVEYRKVEKWDGHLPQVSGGGGTLVNLK
jgi:regulator of protease activity HflC (stomatin/prohibitin superfamily)